jgi:hypothetical protein
MYKSLWVGLLVAGLFGPMVAEAQDAATSAPSLFRFELEEAANAYRGPAVEGYLYNGLGWRIGNVRLRIESVDPAGRVTGQAYGWVLGNVLAGGRAYFFVPVSVPGATYRATVESFDKVSIEAP